MRTRAVTISGLVVTASAFLVGTGLANENVNRGIFFYVLGAAGTAAFILLFICLVRIIYPSIEFKFTLESGPLLSWMDGKNPAPSRRVALRMLAVRVQKMFDHNIESLNILRSRYRMLLWVSMITTGIWITTVWFFA
ncbi:hypothetical protein NBM05_08505 [Rothia sp. AR01]|uniref:Uncharacterized protein n=1 Tax=Rothia santali TaxID=2949643 RepID=A0A9X2HE57_9MICC|nr:hypothetical protein [Rothia santali]MCP3426042.1 hypothetical protein [Rothia santali]